MTYNELRVGHILLAKKIGVVWCVLKDGYATNLLLDRQSRACSQDSVTQEIHFIPMELI